MLLVDVIIRGLLRDAVQLLLYEVTTLDVTLEIYYNRWMPSVIRRRAARKQG